MESINPNYQYNFEETISLVFLIIKKCCKRMAEYYENVMNSRFENQEEYLQSHYTYYEANVLHGERIIHTHIRYIDTYRLFVLRELSDNNEKTNINKLLVTAIKNYINIGEKYPKDLTPMSTKNLFPIFKEKIKTITLSEFKDFETRIDVKKL